MFEEIPDQISYLNERYRELCALAQAEVDEIEVSSGVRNITQDILTRSSKLLDSIIFEYVENRILPKLPTGTRFRENQVYFPILKDGENPSKMFQSCGISDITVLDPAFQKVLENYQPSQGHQWVQQIKNLSNLGHRRLVRQKKHAQPTVNIGNVIQVSGNGVTMNNVMINGLLVEDFRFEDGRVTARVDPRLSITMTKIVAYLSEGSDPVNVLGLLKEVLEKIPNVTKDLTAIQ